MTLLLLIGSIWLTLCALATWYWVRLKRGEAVMTDEWPIENLADRQQDGPPGMSQWIDENIWDLS